jgi:hypothetical protein
MHGTSAMTYQDKEPYINFETYMHVQYFKRMTKDCNYTLNHPCKIKKILKGTVSRDGFGF